jgi:hypothetical protein
MGIEHVQAEEQIADILMKPLAHERFCALHEKLGVVMMGKKLQDYGVNCETRL